VAGSQAVVGRVGGLDAVLEPGAGDELGRRRAPARRPAAVLQGLAVAVPAGEQYEQR